MKAVLANSIRFDPADPRGSLDGLPEAPGIFALCAADPAAEPYLSKTPNLRRRLMRFLRGPQAPRSLDKVPRPATKRLQLAHIVDHIEYTVTGSEFESPFMLYEASLRPLVTGPAAAAPSSARFLADGGRECVSTRLHDGQDQQGRGQRSLRAVSLARGGGAVCGRDAESLSFAPVYGEPEPRSGFSGLPLFGDEDVSRALLSSGCTDERYRQEASDVLAFLTTRGSSLLAQIGKPAQSGLGGARI